MLSSGLSIASYGQVQTTNLQPAAAYDAGSITLDQGGLAPDLWRGTTAIRARTLIEKIEVSTLGNNVARSLVRAALLSAGAPPESEDTLGYSLYTQARLNAILNLDEVNAFTRITTHSDINTDSLGYRKIFADHALRTGQTEIACRKADMAKIERKAPYWAKLRAYCHYTRDEIAAAELTMDIVRRTEHKDDAFFALLGNLTGSLIKPPKMDALRTPLHIAMAKDYFGQQHSQDKNFKTDNLPPTLAYALAIDATQTPKTRLSSLKKSAHILSSTQIMNIINDFNGITDDLAGSNAPRSQNNQNLKNLVWTPQHWAQAFHDLTTNSDMQSNTETIQYILSQAARLDIFKPISQTLAQYTAVIPYAFQARHNSQIFARLAVQNNDLSALQGIYQNLSNDNDNLRARIALASDAIGGGFMLTELGLDIETRLQSSGKTKADITHKSRAVRDAYIAFGLGANLSQPAIDVLLTAKLEGYAASAGELAALKDAVRRNAPAETALRAAQIIGNRSLSALRADTLSTILSAFNDVGMNHISGQLAAQDFLSGL